MEGLEVTCAPDGVPVSFVLEGSTWHVAAESVRWFERTPWWEEVTSIPRGQRFNMDIEVWQLQARRVQSREALQAPQSHERPTQAQTDPDLTGQDQESQQTANDEQPAPVTFVLVRNQNTGEWTVRSVTAI
ncbi:UNVERIFIED_ORG: hypothetical protein ABIB52_000785 [Arthrobacter sp. UYCu721]